MKVLGSESLTKLIQLIKGSFISSTDVVKTGAVTIATVATTGNYNDLDNKPTIPTVNDATLTITQGGTTKGTFTANANSNVTINLDSGGGTVDQSYDATSINAQSGVAIAGAGFLTSVSSSDIINALGYTPYSSSNPSGYQTTSNLVTSISSASTDSQYPSAKCVNDLIGDIETLINAL